MDEAELTERQRRELTFHKEYMRRNPVEEITFAPVEGQERRPWNPYWFVYDVLRDRCRPRQQRILDFGCGPGMWSLRLARMGFEVHAFDISPESVANAKKIAERYDLADRVSFKVQTAERLSYADGLFDAVCGIDILHHVDIPLAMAECARVLRPGGVAVFREPLEVPVLDALRNAGIVRRIAPKTASLERYITEDERKLNADDLAAIRRVFPDLTLHRFRVLSRLNYFVRKDAFETMLEKIDQGLLRIVPGLASLGGTAVLVMTRPEVSSASHRADTPVNAASA